MSKKNILFINGITDNNKLMVHSVDENGRHILMYPDNRHLYGYIQGDNFNKTLINLDTDLNQRIKPGQFDVVFNQVSDVDTHKTTLMKMEQIHREYDGKIPFFNPPANVKKTAKDNVYQLLQGIDKLRVPKTVRIQPKSPSDIYHTIEKENFGFPLILRQTEDNRTAQLIKKTGEMFYSVPLDGRDYYLIEIIDSNQSDIDLTYRLMIIDGEVFIANAMFSINGKIIDKDPEYLKKEEEISSSFDNDIKPNIQSIIDEIHNRLNLDYFSITCHIDGTFRMTLLDLNANVDLFVHPDKTRKSIWIPKAQQIQTAIVEMLEKNL